MLITNNERIISNISEEIKKHKTFFLTTHQIPDGDGLGCELAFFLLLQKLDKKTIIVNEISPSPIYSFLPGYSDVLTFEKYEKNITPEVVVVFDCSNRERIGKINSLIPESSLVINIDHHEDNTLFGNINWVEEKTSSVGEMCYFIAKELGCIDKKIAECLYVSILTDTGSFKYNFDINTIKVILELLKTGIDPEKIADQVYFNNSIAALKLLGHALVSLKYEPDLKVAWAVLDENVFDETGALEQDTELVINLLRTTGETDFVFLAKERKNEIKFSLRSKKSFNVRKIAEVFGGGGHENAAGFSLKETTLEKAIQTFFKYIRKNRKKWNIK